MVVDRQPRAQRHGPVKHDAVDRAGDRLLVEIPLGDVQSSLGDGRFLPASSAKSDGGYVGGFSVLQAQSIDEASSLLEDHPHFHAPGASIEVHEMLPMPGAEM